MEGITESNRPEIGSSSCSPPKLHRFEGISGPLHWLDSPRDTAFLTEEMHAGIYRDGEELKRLPTSATKSPLQINHHS